MEAQKFALRVLGVAIWVKKGKRLRVILKLLLAEQTCYFNIDVLICVHVDKN